MRCVTTGWLLIAILLWTMNAWAAPVCPGPVSGSTTCSFQAYSFASIDPQPVSVSATCRAVEARAYYFVEDSLWGNSVTQAKLDTLIAALETQTPAFTDKGVIESVTSFFGPLPNVFDQDSHLYVVIHDIADTSIDPVTAYIRDVDLDKDFFGDPLPGSNQHEILFLDKADLDKTIRQADVARELMNMIHFSYDPDEEAWVKDVMARWATYYLGYLDYTSDIGLFANDSAHSLIGEQEAGRVLLDPGATLLFGIYLYEHFDKNPFFFSDWAQSDLTGVAGFEFILPLMGDSNGNFCDYLNNWVIQNMIDRADYAYADFNPPSFTGSFIRQHPGTTSPVITAYAGSYVEIDAGDLLAEQTLGVTFEVPNTTGMRITAAKLDSGNPTYLEIEELTVLAGQPTQFLFDDVGEAFDRLILISSRCSEAAPMLYTVTTSVIEPEADGDVETDGDADDETESELEEELESVDSDGDVDQDADAGESSGPTITGSKTCPQINACYSACEDSLCQDVCVTDGTAEAQEQWEHYINCISGQNPEGIDCLSFSNAEERKACLYRNCHLAVENCAVVEEVDVDPDDLGGSSCRSVSHPAAMLVGLLLVLGLAWRRREGFGA